MIWEVYLRSTYQQHTAIQSIVYDKKKQNGGIKTGTMTTQIIIGNA